MPGRADGAPVRVKICGITDAADARLALELGADLLGLNFYAGSPRAIAARRAAEIREAVGPEACLVGIFVNHGRDEVEALARAARLDLLQFHGDEGPAEIAPFASRAIKVFRPGPDFDAGELARYDDCWGFLFDAPHETLYGGSGSSWAYDRIAPLLGGRPVLVAGGIRPTNVRRVVQSLPGLYGVDVCSGVEAAPGRKDSKLLAELFSQVRSIPSMEVSNGTRNSIR